MGARIKATVMRATDAHVHLNLFDGSKGVGAIILQRSTWDATGDEALMAPDGAEADLEITLIGLTLGDAPDTAARRQSRADHSAGDV